MSDLTQGASQLDSISIDNSRARFRAFIKPIVIVLVLAIILSLLTLDYYNILQDTFPDFTPPDISPIPENPEDPGGIAWGAFLNMLYYVLIAFIGGIIVLFIIKKGFMRFLTYFFALLMGFSWFTFGLFFGGIISTKILDLIWRFLPSIIQQTINDVYIPILYLFAILIAILGFLTFGIQSFDKIWLRNTMMIFFGAMIGSLFALHLPLLTAFLILIGLSFYDIYAVFRGPLKGIIDHGRKTAGEVEDLSSLGDNQDVVYEPVPLFPALPVYSTPLINIGLGDFAFFSMLISVAVVIGISLASPFPLILSFIGLLIGVLYTFKLLQKERALPGLPLPIFGGISSLILGVVLSWALGLTDLSTIVSLFI